MSQLVKLSTTTDINRDTNSFYCISDEDIIIKPNSKVSLLNCQISSGVLKSYEIQGTDLVGGVTGQIWATLDFVYPVVDNTYTHRLILPNGNYNITQLVLALKKSVVDALTAASSSRYNIGTDTVLPLPENSPEFELAVDVSINAQNKIQINYNSKPLITGVAITYPNVKTNINVDAATGIVSYAGPANITSLQIDSTATTGTFNQPTVTSTQSIIGKFVVGDTVFLQSATNNSVQPLKYSVKTITIDNNNLDTARVANTPDYPTKTIRVDNLSGTGGISVGDKVSCDNGASVPGTIDPSFIFGQVGALANEYQNYNTQIKPLSVVPIDLTALASYQINSLPVALPNNVWLTSIPTVGANSLEDHWVVLYNAAGQLQTVGQITKWTQGTPNDQIEITVYPTNQNSEPDTVFMPLMNGGSLVDYSVLTSQDLGASYANINDEMLPDSNYWLVWKGLPLARIQVITATGTSPRIAFELDLTSTNWEVLNGAQDTLLDELQGFLSLINDFGIVQGTTDPIAVVPTYALLSSVPLDFNTVPLAQDDIIVLTNNKVQIPNTDDTIMREDPSNLSVGGDDYTLFEIKVDLADAFDEFVQIQEIWESLLTNTVTNIYDIFKTDVSERLIITFAAFDGQPNEDVRFAAATRIWEGEGIEDTYTVLLSRSGAPRPGFNFAAYDLLVSATTNDVGAQNAFALAEEAVNTGAGRAVFQITTLPNQASGCDFGLLNSGVQAFGNLSCAAADYKISVELSGGNLIYALYRNGVRVPFGAGSDVIAQLNDRIAIQWNCAFSPNDKQWIAKPPNLNLPVAQYGAYVDSVEPGQPIAAERDLMRNNVVISISRAGATAYQYLGAPVNATGNNIYPYTPLDNPTIAPVKWDGTLSYNPYIRPGLGGAVKMLEYTPFPLTTNINGVKAPFDGTAYAFHPDLHTVDLIVSQQEESTKYTDPASAFVLTFPDNRIQKLLGFSESQYYVNGSAGSIVANKDYITANLPENLIVLLENLPSVSSFDTGQVSGQRRQILATCINTQSDTGEINIEPSNLYRIGLNNTAPINMRKFICSFEDFYGSRIKLQNAKATVNLLIESP